MAVFPKEITSTVCVQKDEPSFSVTSHQLLCLSGTFSCFRFGKDFLLPCVVESPVTYSIQAELAHLLEPQETSLLAALVFL